MKAVYTADFPTKEIKGISSVKTKNYNIASFPRTTFPVQVGKSKRHPTLTSCILLSDYFLSPSSVIPFVTFSPCLTLPHAVSAEAVSGLPLFLLLIQVFLSFPALGNGLRLMAISGSPEHSWPPVHVRFDHREMPARRDSERQFCVHAVVNGHKFSS